MTYASLLVAVDEGIESDSRLELACDLAISFDAHLTGLCVGAVAPPLYDPMSGGAMVGELLTLYRDMAEAEVGRARQSFADVVGPRQVASEFKGEVGYPAQAFTRTGRIADLLILGCRNARSPYHAPDVADVLMGCGRPVLAVPPARVRNPLGAPALIAWKDSRESRLAVTAALPLLRRAREVAICTVCPDPARPAAEAELKEVAAWLERHEVSAAPLVLNRGLAGTTGRLIETALDRGCGLIVAGGYGHARLREWALGGVTRALLSESPVCLLLAH